METIYSNRNICCNQRIGAEIEDKNLRVRRDEEEYYSAKESEKQHAR